MRSKLFNVFFKSGLNLFKYKRIREFCIFIYLFNHIFILFKMTNPLLLFRKLIPAF